MNILVCVKQVPDDYVKVYLNESGEPSVEKIEKVVHAFDTYATELAVRLVEKHGGKVTVVSVGDEAALRPSLVQQIAVGAGSGVIGLADTKGKDESAVAELLKELAGKAEETAGEAFDLILCGKESTDLIGSQVGAMLAEKMGLPFVSSVIEAEPSETGLLVKQETEEGYARYEVKTPAVFTIAKPDYEPRYPTLKSKMAARKAQIPTIALSETGEALVQVTGYSEPAKREAGVKIQEKEAIDAVTKAMELLTKDKVL